VVESGKTSANEVNAGLNDTQRPLPTQPSNDEIEGAQPQNI